VQIRLKTCFKCEKEKVIWKNWEGNKYCLYCYLQVNPPVRKIPVIKPIKPRSSKRASEESDYKQKRIFFLLKNPHCQAKLIGCCTHESTEVHHMRGRIGILLLDQEYWLPVCRACHAWIEVNPTLAKELNLSQSRLEIAS
jgi:hypothetical protein